MPAHRLLKPHFLYRPRQIVRRLEARRRHRPAQLQLPWGLTITCDPREEIGSSIARTGVHELAVTELLLRLIDPGDRCADVGANIGYTTSVMAIAAGPTGSIDAFEPLPALYDELTANVDHWRAAGVRCAVVTHRVACSQTAGRALLHLPQAFARNRGTATLQPAPHPRSSGSTVDVTLTTLDDALSAQGPTAVVKIDVEGHELEVLRGAGTLLAAGRIRDIVFEEHAPLPTPASAMLAAHGYRLFGIAERLRGVALVAPDHREAIPRWSAPTYLATLDPERALERTAARGWRALRRRPAA